MDRSRGTRRNAPGIDGGAPPPLGRGPFRHSPALRYDDVSSLREPSVMIAVRPVVLAAALGLASTVAAADPERGAATRATNPEHPMSVHASGTFDVRIVALALADGAPDDTRGRMSINKQFHGDLDATSVGEMLTATTATSGSMAYAAIERVSGTLNGRKGSFVLQHTGVTNRGAPSLVVTVVPDSGTGELLGLSGTLTITIAGGIHSYDLAYSLPDAAP